MKVLVLFVSHSIFDSSKLIQNTRFPNRDCTEAKHLNLFRRDRGGLVRKAIHMKLRADNMLKQPDWPRELSQKAGYQRTTAAVSREIAGETVVVPICRGVGDLDSVFTFNQVGGALWRQLESQRTAEELSTWIAERFKISEEQAVADVRAFLADLLEAGLVRAA